MGSQDFTIPNLINGLSQQPRIARLPDQAESVLNCTCNILDMLGRRPPLEIINKPGGGLIPVNSYVHSVSQTSSGGYFVVASPASVRVIGFNGLEQTVISPPPSYFNSSNPRVDYSAFTYKDTTFFANKAVTCAYTGTLSQARTKESTVQIKAAIIGCTYTIGLRFGATVRNASYTAVSTDTPTTIAAALAAGIATTAGPDGFIVATLGHVVYIAHVSLAYTLEGIDNRSNTAIGVFKDTVQRFSDLTSINQDGYLVNVLGDTSSEADNVYYKFISSRPGTLGTGQWQEASAPAIPFQLNPATMPYQLRQVSMGVFDLLPITTWGSRLSGDQVSNPDPPFIGNSINSVFILNDRLGFLTRDSVVMSRTQEVNYFEFFRKSQKALIDSDPIATRVSSGDVIQLNHAVPFDKKLAIFGASGEYTMSWGDVLSPKTANISTSTSVGSSPALRPVVVGNNIVFAKDNGPWSSIHELSSESVTGVTVPAELTAHCQAFIPSGVTMCANPRRDMLAFTTPSSPNKLYIHNYFYQNQTKAQNAFHEWELPAGTKIQGIHFQGMSLIVLWSDLEEEVYVGKIDLSAKAFDAPFKRKVCLDYRVSGPQITKVDNVALGTCTLTIPYTPSDKTRVVSQDTGPDGLGGLLPAGTSLPVLSYNTTTNEVVIPYDYRQLPLYVGEEYESRYVFNELFIRSEDNRPLSQFQVVLDSFAVDYFDTGYFKLKIGDSVREEGLRLGTGVLGVQPLRSSFLMMDTSGLRVKPNSVSISSTSHLPFFIASARWAGLADRKSPNVC